MKGLRLPRRYAALGAPNLPSDIHLTDISRRCCLANQNLNLVRHRSWDVIFITIQLAADSSEYVVGTRVAGVHVYKGVKAQQFSR